MLPLCLHQYSMGSFPYKMGQLLTPPLHEHVWNPGFVLSMGSVSNWNKVFPKLYLTLDVQGILRGVLLLSAVETQLQSHRVFIYFSAETASCILVCQACIFSPVQQSERYLEFMKDEVLTLQVQTNIG